MVGHGRDAGRSALGRNGCARFTRNPSICCRNACIGSTASSLRWCFRSRTPLHDARIWNIGRWWCVDASDPHGRPVHVRSHVGLRTFHDVVVSFSAFLLSSCTSSASFVRWVARASDAPATRRSFPLRCGRTRFDTRILILRLPARVHGRVRSCPSALSSLFLLLGSVRFAWRSTHFRSFVRIVVSLRLFLLLVVHSHGHARRVVVATHLVSAGPAGVHQSFPGPVFFGIQQVVAGGTEPQLRSAHGRTCPPSSSNHASLSAVKRPPLGVCHTTPHHNTHTFPECAIRSH